MELIVDNSSNAENSENSSQIKVWDFPTRFFHWSLVIALALCWLSIDMRWLTVHQYSGMYILLLLVFRIIWGVIGAKTARFVDFITWPWHAFKYLKRSLSGTNEYHAGHNPAGGWMVVAMLILLIAQVLSGLFANDDIGFSGPLADFVTKESSDWATQIHSLFFDGLLLLTWLHIIAVFFYYLVKLQNLIRAMITGYKPSAQVGNHQLFFVTKIRTVLGIAIALTTTLVVFNWQFITMLLN